MTSETQLRKSKRRTSHDSPVIEEVHCASWAEFLRVLREKVYKSKEFVEGEFLYRGQSSPTYQLTTSFDRWFKGEKAHRPDVAHDLLKVFRQECEEDPAIPPALIQSDDRLRALAQHHGLPTRLLDWTVSPYVAAFFALSYTFSDDVILDRDVAIWVLDPHAKIWSEEFGAYVVASAVYDNKRLQRQGGRFTHLVGAFDSLEDFVTHVHARHVLRKIVLSTRDIGYALAELKAMQIDHASLFPGVEGYAMEAKTRIGLREKIKQVKSK